MLRVEGFEVEVQTPEGVEWFPVEWFDSFPLDNGRSGVGLAIMSVFFNPKQGRFEVSQAKLRRRKLG